MDTLTIALRLMLITVIAGVIGYEREFKSRPAGIRTHVLVGIGATVIALIQQNIEHEALTFAIENIELAGIVRSDPARLIAQVVSGVGFLGAGTIIVQRRSIKGLTTAASLWATAGLGIATGMGYYVIAVLGCLAILLTLVFLKRVIVIHAVKKLEVKYIHKQETIPYIKEYFKANGIVVKDVDMSVEIMGETRVYTNIYDIEMPKDFLETDIIEDIAKSRNITKIRMISI